MLRRAAMLCVALLAVGAPGAAQTTSRPGPWALDVRGVTSPVPQQAVFYPTLASGTLVPSRGFGLDLGLHVYLLNVGSSRLGIGVNALNIRATTEPPPPAPSTGGTSSQTPAGQRLQLDMRMVVPQVSFNFGTRDGWSYLSGGAGTVDVVARTTQLAPGRRQSERLNALNVGGGARWFMRSHLAFGFDVRLHKIAAGTAGLIERPGSATEPPPAPEPPPPTPGMMILTVGAGFSFR